MSQRPNSPSEKRNVKKLFFGYETELIIDPGDQNRDIEGALVVRDKYISFFLVYFLGTCDLNPDPAHRQNWTFGSLLELRGFGMFCLLDVMQALYGSGFALAGEPSARPATPQSEP